MMPLVALCADETSLAHPELIGLSGEQLAAQPWLRLFSAGIEMRTFLRSDRAVDEAWIVTCDDVEPINLAAALKADRGDLRVCLVTFRGTGSLRSRASAAGVDVTLTRQAFVARYAALKRVRSSAAIPGGQRGLSAVPSPIGETVLPWSAYGEGNDSSGPLFQPEEPRLPQRPEAVLMPPKPQMAATMQASSRAASPPPPTGSPVIQAPAPASCPQVLSTAPGMPSGTFLLPIVSGSGGSGKSTVAALAAELSARRGLKTLLLDFDLQFGDMREMAGVPDALGIDEALADPGRLAQLSAATGRPAVLGAPRHLEEAESLARRAPALLEALGGRFEAIVANTGAAWAEQHAVLLERCTKALFLIDQRASSIAACRRALDLCARCGIAVSPFLFVVNFCSKSAPLTSIDASCALRGAQAVELADGGAEVEEILSEGHPQDLIEAGNPLASSLASLLSNILPLPEGSDGLAPEMAPARRKHLKRRRRRRAL